jgi:hypothetical protein
MSVISKLFKNKKGVAPTISAIMMVLITVISMTIAIGVGQNIITTRSEQMGERLCVEKVFFNSTHIQTYVRNTGHGDLTLENAIVNGKMYDFFEGRVTLFEDFGQFVFISNYDVDPQGMYVISFISSRNDGLGITEVEYP